VVTSLLRVRYGEACGQRPVPILGQRVYAAANRVEQAMRDLHAISVTFEQPSIQARRGDAGRVLAGEQPKLPIF
jgi:hypothetical protein